MTLYIYTLNCRISVGEYFENGKKHQRAKLIGWIQTICEGETIIIANNEKYVKLVGSFTLKQASYMGHVSSQLQWDRMILCVYKSAEFKLNQIKLEVEHVE